MGVPPRAEFLCLLSCSRTRHFPSQMFFCLLASNPLGIPDDLPKGEYEYHLKQQPHFAAWLTSSQPTTLESPILYHAKINHFTFCDTSWLKQLKSFPFLYFHQNSTITQNFLQCRIDYHTAMPHWLATLQTKTVGLINSQWRDWCLYSDQILISNFGWKSSGSAEN